MPIVSDPVAAAALPAPQYGFSSILSTSGTTTNLSSLDWSRRTGIIWKNIEADPGSGSYDWSVVDNAAQNAIEFNYNLFVVVKTGNSSIYSDPACFAVADTSFQGDGESNSLVSCPIKKAYLPAWRRFIRAMIRRYGKGINEDAMPGMTDSFRIEIQIENEPNSKKFWNIDILGDGKLAAQNYLKILKQAYLAKQIENSTVPIILAGIADPARAELCTNRPDTPGESCGTTKTLRTIAFWEEMFKYPQYFDAVDLHLFSYQYFLPLSVPNAMAWARGMARKNGWNLTDKAVYACEWTPAFVKHAGAKPGGDDALKNYYPASLAAALAPVGYLEAPILYDSNAQPVDEGIPPCYFSGDYTGAGTRIFGVLMTAEQADASPQQYQWTSAYTGVASSTWVGPVDCSTSPHLMAFGVSVIWDSATGHTAPFGVAATAHPDTDPVTLDTLGYYYDNIDFLENDTSLPTTPSPGMQSPLHKDWFDAEEAIDLPKAYCAMLVEGIRKFSFVKFPNYYPGYSWDERWWKFHGVIRVTGATSGALIWHAKPSYWAHNQFVAATSGFTAVSRYHGLGNGVVGYGFTFASGPPTYMFWGETTNTLDAPDYDGGDVVLNSAITAIHTALGWNSALVTEFVTDLDGSKNPVYVSTTTSGATTTTIGNTPIIVTKVS